jgi:hypothetical protein
VNPNPADLPCARELFAQWLRARGGRDQPASRPFSRSWEDLLDDARLVSGVEREEAGRDARALAADGWIECKTVRYRPHLLERVSIPLSAEPRWARAFGFTPPSDGEESRLRAFPWEPELAFVVDARLGLPMAELERLNDFIKRRAPEQEIVPIKERSLQLFGDEKRLDLLLSSALFRPGRLDPARHLRCEVVGVPLAWKRGPSAAANEPVIAIENAATWHSYCRWNVRTARFSAVVYGDGNRFVEGTRYLGELFEELGGSRPVLYFGDLDVPGLVIPREASVRSQAMGGPPILPHLWSYGELLKFAARSDVPPLEEDAFPASLCDWLGPHAGAARQLLAAGRRLAQEHIGWDLLKLRLGS